MALLGIYYVSFLKRGITRRGEGYLREVAEHVSDMVDYRVDTTFQTLESIAKSYVQMESPEEQEAFLADKEQRYHFLYLKMVETDATIETDDGAIDLFSEAYIQKALAGEMAVSDLVSSPIDGQEAIIYALPVYKNGNIIGALSACVAKEAFHTALAVESFEGQGFCHIINTEGRFILTSANRNSQSAGYANFLDMVEHHGGVRHGESLTKMREDMKNGQSGLLHFTVADGAEKTLVYLPLAEQDWYLLSVVPTKVVEQKADSFVLTAEVIITVVTGLFLALVVLLLFLQRRNQQNLERIAFVDPITGGANRAKFEQEASQAIQKSPGGSYALVSLDIQKFRLINDISSSADGDRVLQHLYSVICAHLQEGEYAARITGDIFHLLLFFSSEQQIVRRLDRIAEDVNAFNNERSEKYYLALYEGIYPIEDPSVPLISAQDRANVARKRNKQAKGLFVGLHSYLFYSELERQRLMRKKDIENSMEAAMENGEFVVYYQPKVSLISQKTVGAEALVRWNDPREESPLLPREFLPVMERTGFVVRLDLFVFEQVCKALKSWIERGIPAVPISINLSRVHLRSPYFLRAFEKIRRRYDIPASLVEMELTEALVLENFDVLRKVIGEIQTAGFSVALDDFGSGYSSLSVLKDVPADVLKLDRAFLRNEKGQYERSRDVMESVIGLAKQLNMRIITEGVETEEQIEFLKSAQCDVVQGFIYSGPIPLSEFEQYAFGDAAIAAKPEGEDLCQ